MLFVIWVNAGWLIILVGAQVACYWQHPHRLRPPSSGPSGGDRNALALAIMVLIGRAHYRRDPPWTFNRLAAQSGVSSLKTVAAVVSALQRKGLIVASSEEPPFYLPAYDIGVIGLRDIVAAVREEGGASAQSPTVSKVMDRIDAAVDQALQDQTLKDLVLADETSER